MSRFSAAMAAATEGGKCIKLSLSVGLSSVSGTGNDGTVENKASMSFSVNKGWSWFFVLPLMKAVLFLLLLSLYMLSSTVPLTWLSHKNNKRHYRSVLLENVNFKVIKNCEIKYPRCRDEIAHTIKRWARVLFVCPIRCTLLIACASTAGFKSGSMRITCFASNRLRPFAPCWIKSSNTWIDLPSGFRPCNLWYPVKLLFSPLNSLMATCDFLKLQSQRCKWS